MATRIKITCDRCGKIVEGLEDEAWTSGFYRLRGYWSQFAHSKAEEKICDACMLADPKYQEIYLQRRIG